MSDSFPSESFPPEPSRRRRFWVGFLTWLVLIVVAVPTLARPLARYDGMVDLLTHFQVANVLGSTLAVLILWRPRRRLALLAIVLAVVQAAPLVPFYGPNPVRPASPDRLRLVVLNLLVDNPDHPAVERFLAQQNPDLIGLLEFTPTWKRALRRISDRYPYRIDHPDGPQGLALWSRRPLRDSRVERYLMRGWPCIRTRLDFGGQPLQLWLVHPSSPVRRLHQRGFPELSALASRVADQAGARLIVGDLNTTSGSPHFTDFLGRTGLRDSRLGFGIQGTWPSGSPYRIAIDHALMSPDLAVTERRVGPNVGSDHLPVILEIAPYRADRQRETVTSDSAP